MSDGNFNRKLIPSDQYQSGLRAGEARMRQRAIIAFRRWITEREPDMSPQQLQAEEQIFHKLLLTQIGH